MYGAFGNVAAMYVRRDKLVDPLFNDDALVFSAGLVVHDVEVDLVAALLETLHNGVVCGNTMIVATGAERGLENCVGVAVVYNHDVLISTARLDGELATVIYVQFSDWFFKEMDFICGGEGRGQRGP